MFITPNSLYDFEWNYSRQKNRPRVLAIRLKDEEVRIEIEKIVLGFNIAQIKSLPKNERNEIIKKAKYIEGVSQRQLARILGVSQTLISIA